MLHRSTRVGLALTALLLIAFPRLSAAQATAYSITDLGSLGGASGAYGLNLVSEAVGYSFLPGSTTLLHAVLYENGHPVDLGTLGGSKSLAHKVNANGDACGWSLTASGGRHAFFYKGGGMRDLGTFGGTISDANDLNAAGQVVGSAYLPGDQYEHAFLWSDADGIKDLGTLGGTASVALGVNRYGDTAGFSALAGDVFLRAFFYHNGTMKNLGTLGGSDSKATDVNDDGKVCGFSLTRNDLAYHAFVWSDGVMVDLGTLSSVPSSVAYAINSSGEVVGLSYTEDDRQVAVLNDGTRWVDLNYLIPANSGWQLSAAYDINEFAQIVGVGTLNGDSHAFLLTPNSLLNVDPAHAASVLEFAGASPNPVRDRARFEFSLPTPGRVKLELFDASGRRVCRLADDAFGAGRATVVWDGRGEDGASVGTGLYWARLEASGRTLVRRVVRVR